MESQARTVKAFLRDTIQNKDAQFEENLKKSFILGKRKAKKKVNDKRTTKSKLMTRREKKAMGMYHVPVKGMKYEDVLPMNALWLEYMKSQINLKGKPIPELHEKAWENFSATLYKSDFHGALVSVVDSKCSTLIGLTGICIMETKNTFKIITKDNLVKTVPKEGSFFKFHCDEFHFSFFGKHIARKPAERSIKIPKSISLPEL